MSKFAYGPASCYIQGSGGPSPSSLQFYSTMYSTTYNNGRRDEKDYPYGISCRHKGTGYSANFRPAVYYSPKMDEVENPLMRKLMEDNYNTSAQRDFAGPLVPDSKAPFPEHVVSHISGYAHNTPATLPTQRQVHEVHVDTRLRAPLPVYPQHAPTLRTIEPRDPVAMENAGHGPKAMTTEYHSQFPRKKLSDDAKGKSCYSNLEGSGFVHAQNIEPVTFRPTENHNGDLPGYLTWRPTGTSVMSNHFNTPVYLKGNEPLHSLRTRADISNGYVKGNSADADVQPRTPNRDQYGTLTRGDFRGVQHPTLSEARRLRREDVGTKERTGFTNNTPPFVEPRDKDRGRFSTHYQSRFIDHQPKGYARHGNVANGGGVQLPVVDGYTKNTSVHKYGPPISTSKELRTMHPYVARSTLRKDPSFDDHTHDRKVHIAY